MKTTPRISRIHVESTMEIMNGQIASKILKIKRKMTIIDQMSRCLKKIKAMETPIIKTNILMRNKEIKTMEMIHLVQTTPIMMTSQIA
jgi:hypothetical protein